MTQPVDPSQTDPAQPDPAQPDPAQHYDPRTDPNHPEFDPNYDPNAEGEKYEGGDIPQTGEEEPQQQDESQTTE